MGAGADACATKGVLGDAGTAGDSERGGMADGSVYYPRGRRPYIYIAYISFIGIHKLLLSVTRG